MDDVLKTLSDFAVSLKYEKLPQDVVHQVKRRVIDSLGCAMGGYFEEPPKIARAHASEVTSKPGATILGTKHVTSPELAAFANGVMVRYLDFNDTSLAVDGGHPSDNIPAVLAAGEYAKVDGKAVITGIALAYEVQDRLQDVCGLFNRGWDHTTYVAISAAAGSGKVLGLNQAQMANSLGLAMVYAAMGQIRVGSLSMWKGCAAANATRNGLFYSLLAKRGMTGPAEAFRGPRGFVKQLTSGNVQLPALGDENRRFKVQDAKYKFFPTDYECQCSIHPALELREALGGKTDEIEKIVIDTYDLAVDVAADTPDKWNPTTRETADHSLPYVQALALTKGDVWLDDFTEEKIRDPKIQSLMQKIEVRRNDEFTKAYPDAYVFRIDVKLRSGEKLVREIWYAKGHPKNPMSDQEIEQKFRRLTGQILKPAQADQILNRLWHLEEVREMCEILDLFDLKR